MPTILPYLTPLVTRLLLKSVIEAGQPYGSNNKGTASIPIGPTPETQSFSGNTSSLPADPVLRSRRSIDSIPTTLVISIRSRRILTLSIPLVG